jgi:hypothetical protein
MTRYSAGPGATPLWPTIEMRALFAQDADRTASAPRVAVRARIGPGFAIVADRARGAGRLVDLSRCVSAGGSGSPGGQAVDAADAVRVELDPVRRLAPARMPPRCA